MKNEEITLQEFNVTLPFPVTDARLLKNVFVHTSYLNESGGAGLESNERLEFLGDAVLQFIISRLLFERFPQLDEGALTQMRARLVNKRTLAGIAGELEMSRFLFLGKGEAASGGQTNPTILAGAFEALVAAVYFDAGMQSCVAFIDRTFMALMDDAEKEPGHFDYKPALQELTQKIFRSAPIYRQTRETGPPHKRVFEVEVAVNGEVVGTGTASRKKDAEQEAAKEALRRLKAEGKK